MSIFGNKKENEVTVYSEVSSVPIKIETKRDERPYFKRIYEMQVTEEITIKAEMKSTHYGKTYDLCTLNQRDGKWVLFDINKPADKIFDPKLLPLVEKCSKEILQIDNGFRKNPPNEFIDDTGQKWIRAEG